MRILYVAGRELNYSRNDVLLRSLRQIGLVEVLGVRQKPDSLILNSLSLSFQAIWKLVTRRYDLVCVGFYGHLLMAPVSLFARQPVLFDAFVSNFDTLSSDRGLISPGSPVARLAYWLDQTACRQANHVLLDTPSHVAYFIQTFQLDPRKVSALPVGCNEDLFFPQPRAQRGSQTIVLYYSTYQPLHGVETVVQAAGLLRSENGISFRLIGAGQEYERVRRVAAELELQNVSFLPYVPLAVLPQEIAAADICLGGHFGLSDKAARVIPGKIYQILAAGRPLIAARTPANLDLLCHGENAFLCPPGDPQALASAILQLHQDRSFQQRLADGGRVLYEARCSEAIIKEQVRQIVIHLTGAN